MPNYTSRFNLSKPLTTENYDIAKVTNENADKLDTSATQLLTTTETITVGTGGQYATINQALEYATKKYPTYVSASTRPRVTISLLSGFVMAEQVIVDGIDLSWITISSVDAEVSITRSALTIANANSRYPAFTAQNGAFLPIINTLFNMDTSGTATSRHGIMAFNNSRAIINSDKGVKNAGGSGIYAYQSSNINANGANASGARTYGIYAYQNSTINAYGIDASGSGLYGIHAIEGSTINANSANASYAGTYGVYATNASTIEFNGGNAQRAGYNTSDVLVNSTADGIYASSSTINADSANASYSARYGVYARSNSRINFAGGIATNTGSYSVFAHTNSTIYAGGSNCSTDGNPSEEYRCSYNSFIEIQSATGEVNTTPELNSYTNAGLITNNTGVITTSGSLPLTGGTLTGALNGTTITTSGDIKNSNLTMRSSALEEHLTNGTGNILVNYRGYQGGTTQFRDLRVYDGKQNLVANFIGSDKSTTLYGALNTNGQIKFPATQNPSSDANTLDDYEEGTFYPTILGTTTAGTGTYTNQIGNYTKIGNLVNVYVYLSWNAHTGTGNMTIGNLPFTTNNICSASIITDQITLTSGYSIVGGYAYSGTNVVNLHQVSTTTGAGANVSMDSAGWVMMNFTYKTNS